jgi:hypothetical protein
LNQSTLSKISSASRTQMYDSIDDIGFSTDIT